MSIDRMIGERLRGYAQREELLVLQKENEALAERIAKLEGQRPMPEKEWYTVKELEPVMGISSSQIRKTFICKGKITASFKGKGYKVTADEFRRIEKSIHVNGGRWKLEGS